MTLGTALRRYAQQTAHYLRRIPSRLASIPKSPHEIALAFSVGVFIGVMPGIGPAFALMVALLFRLSKAATLLGTFTTNPWTVAPIYVASFRIGERLLGAHERIDWQKLRTFESGWPQELLDMAGPLALGGFILGLAMAVTAYALARWTIARYKQQRIKRLAGR